MKILQLNVWDGKVSGALLNFIEQNDFDLICLQEAVWSPKNDILEVFSASVEQIKTASRLNYESRATNYTIQAFDSEIHQGNVILSRTKIVDEKIIAAYGEEKTVSSSQELLDHCFKAQLVKLENGLNVVNYHGYWVPSPVGDETTVAAMQKVAQMIKNTDGPLVMCGDLNVIHESPAMRQLDFLKDLTHEYHINNTLSGLKFDSNIACDHILVNDQIKVLDFKVLDVIISDHKPLIAEIDLQ